MKCISVFAAVASLAFGGAAQAQSFFSCKGNDGQFWGLYRAEGQGLKLWSPGKGWSGDLCAERDCSISDNQIEMRWTSRSEGEYAYTEQQHSLTVNRRSGTGSRGYVGDQWTYDGRPYTPNGWNPHSETNQAGSCAKASDPEGGPAQF